MPFVQFRVTCSKGTYIRSLAHSLGTRLGCGAVLSDLIREESRPFGLDQAVELEQILQDPQVLPRRVLSIPEALPHWPRLCPSSQQAAGIRNGNWLKTEELASGTHSACESRTRGEGERALFVTPRQEPLALAETRLWRGQLYWAILRGLWSS